jgi:hypothetical protein
MDCGGKFHFSAMDFDHRDASTKLNLVSYLKLAANKAALIEEMAKCDLVCSNCHRVRTWKRSKGQTYGI